MLCSPKGLKSGFHGLTLGLVSVVKKLPERSGCYGLAFSLYDERVCYDRRIPAGGGGHAENQSC